MSQMADEPCWLEGLGRLALEGPGSTKTFSN